MSVITGVKVFSGGTAEVFVTAVDRLQEVQVRLLKNAEVIPLGVEILESAIGCQTSCGLSPQDALVCASVLKHLERADPAPSCFLNRNVKDFEDPDLIEILRQRSCRMLPGFDVGCSFLRSRN